MPTQTERRPMCRQVWRRAALFETMAEELHVNLGQAARLDKGDAIAHARARCLDCRAISECEDWLDASFGVPLPPAFCPNAPFFHLCIAAAHGSVMDGD
jgi:hypothetical protein